MTDNQREPSARLVYCLSVDLIGSTDAGMALSTGKLDSFNRSLVEQIKPHLESLELTDVLAKFTGDGWLLMTDDVDRVPALCCLSIIMANRFQDEMSRETGIVIDTIPPLRIAICAGRDVRVTLPDGRIDWVGDSARRTVRASGWCSDSHNEILIDETLRTIVFRDFATKSADLEQRQQPEKMEELFPLHVLGDIKPEVAADSEAPGYFVYTLDNIGRREEAAAVAQQGGERLIDVATKLSTSKKEIPQGTSRKWNRLVSKISDYSTALEMLRAGQAAGFSPDVVTYTMLISKATDYDEAKSWVETMRNDDVQPDAVTYNTLISKAPDYDEAKSWVETMRNDDVQPDAVTYNTLISKAPDYDEAKSWVETMRKESIQPNVVTYTMLISKVPDYNEAKSWVETMLQDGVLPNVVTYNTLISKAPDYDEVTGLVEMMQQDDIQSDVVTYNTLLHKAPNYDVAKMWMETMQKDDIQPDVMTYNTLISKATDYDEAKTLMEVMREEGIPPDVVTYSTLISKAPDCDEVTGLVEMMQQDDIQSDVVTYNTLLHKAPNYDVAKMWMETMQKDDIQPDVMTYNTLISKATDYDEAKTLIEVMREEGIPPDVVTYNTLFGKDLSGKSADEIISWYLAQAYHPEKPIQIAIASYRKSHHIDQALRLALDYPHTEAARKLIRANAGEALAYFSSISERDPNHPNADYALGVSFMELGMEMKAQPHLEKALELAKAGPRKAAIEEWLRQISHKLSHEERPMANLYHRRYHCIG